MIGGVHFDIQNACPGRRTDGMIVESMGTKRRQRASGTTGLIIVFLGLVALIGLLSGLLARTLISHQSSTAQATATAPAGTATHTLPTSTSTGSTTTPTVTGTASTVTGHFRLSVTVTPKTVAPGQQLTITVNAFNPDTRAPIAGLPCTLRAPTDGSQPLLTSWPAPQTTDASGAVTWTVTAPSKPAGTYEVEAFAQTSSWGFKIDSSVNVSAG